MPFYLPTDLLAGRPQVEAVPMPSVLLLRCRMPEEGLGTAQAGAPRDSMLLQQQQMQQQRVQLQQQQHDYSTTRPLPPVASPPLSPSRTHVFELT